MRTAWCYWMIFVTVQQIINESPGFAEVLEKRGISDTKNVITTPPPSAILTAKTA